MTSFTINVSIRILINLSIIRNASMNVKNHVKIKVTTNLCLLPNFFFLINFKPRFNLKTIESDRDKLNKWLRRRAVSDWVQNINVGKLYAPKTPMRVLFFPNFREMALLSRTCVCVLIRLSVFFQSFLCTDVMIVICWK